MLKKTVLTTLSLVLLSSAALAGEGLSICGKCARA